MKPNQIRKTKYKFRSMPEKYRNILGQLPENAHIIVHGKPGQGKSYFCVGLASDIAESGYKVLYLSLEEGYNATMQTKLNSLSVSSENLTISDSKDAGKHSGKLGLFQFVFVDSAQKASVSESHIEDLRSKYPSTCFVFVYQATKAGAHRGALTESHEVDIVLLAQDGKISVEKSRTGGSGVYEIEFRRTISGLGKIVDSGTVPGMDWAEKKTVETPHQIVFNPNSPSFRSGNYIPEKTLNALGFYKLGSRWMVDESAPDKIRQMYNIKGIEFGNWTSQEDRANYLLGLVCSLYDIQKITGLSSYQIGLDGKLSICFGSRGYRGGIAYFSPSSYLINMNRHSRGYFDKNLTGEKRLNSYRFAMAMSGIQAFSHEYGHALDYFFPSAYKSSKAGKKGNYEEESYISGLINELIDKIALMPAYKRMEKVDIENNKIYFTKRTEIFARLIEKYFIMKMKKKGIKNTFMSKFKIHPDIKDGTIKNEVYLTDNEFRQIEKEVDNLFVVMRKSIPNTKPDNCTKKSKVASQTPQPAEKEEEPEIKVGQSWRIIQTLQDKKGKPKTFDSIETITKIDEYVHYSTGFIRLKSFIELVRSGKAVLVSDSPPKKEGKAFKSGNTTHLPIFEIHTDTKRFQNRENEYSKESVERIVNNFDVNKLDPIKVWLDPKNGKTYVVSGHSRLQAFKILHERAMQKIREEYTQERVGFKIQSEASKKRIEKLTQEVNRFKSIPVSFLQGDESEIIRFGKREANYLSTPEKLSEQLRAFKANRDDDKYTQAKLKEVWGSNYNKYEAWSYLNPKGKFIEMLGSDAKVSFPYLEVRAQWVGALRKNYNQITNAHENEIFDFFYLSKAGKEISKEDFISRVEKEVTRIDFDSAKTLNLEKSGNRGTAARSDTAEAQKRLYEIEEELKKLKSKRHNALTKAEKEAISAETLRLIQEKERIEKGIKNVLKTQTSLFGTRKKRIRKG